MIFMSSYKFKLGNKLFYSDNDSIFTNLDLKTLKNLGFSFGKDLGQ
jgi:hypothetical protein